MDMKRKKSLALVTGRTDADLDMPVPRQPIHAQRSRSSRVNFFPIDGQLFWVMECSCLSSSAYLFSICCTHMISSLPFLWFPACLVCSRSCTTIYACSTPLPPPPSSSPPSLALTPAPSSPVPCVCKHSVCVNSPMCLLLIAKQIMLLLLGFCAFLFVWLQSGMLIPASRIQQGALLVAL